MVTMSLPGASPPLQPTSPAQMRADKSPCIARSVQINQGKAGIPVVPPIYTLLPHLTMLDEALIVLFASMFQVWQRESPVISCRHSFCCPFSIDQLFN